jgi:hypothetical protein
MTTVQAAQETVAAEWEGRCTIIDPTALGSLGGDNVHYDETLQIDLGQYIAALIAAAE